MQIFLRCPKGHRRVVGIECAGTAVTCAECGHVWRVPERDHCGGAGASVQSRNGADTCAVIAAAVERAASIDGLVSCSRRIAAGVASGAISGEEARPLQRAVRDRGLALASGDGPGSPGTASPGRRLAPQSSDLPVLEQAARVPASYETPLAWVFGVALIASGIALCGPDYVRVAAIALGALGAGFSIGGLLYSGGSSTLVSALIVAVLPCSLVGAAVGAFLGWAWGRDALLGYVAVALAGIAFGSFVEGCARGASLSRESHSCEWKREAQALRSSRSDRLDANSQERFLVRAAGFMDQMEGVTNEALAALEEARKANAELRCRLSRYEEVA